MQTIDDHMLTKRETAQHAHIATKNVAELQIPQIAHITIYTAGGRLQSTCESFSKRRNNIIDVHLKFAARDRAARANNT